MVFFSILQIVFFIALVGTSFYIAFRKFKEIYDNIMMGKPEHINSTLGFRIKSMLLIAFGQKKMFDRPVVGIMHFVIYAGFLLINVEVLEIVLDGLFGTHRLFAPLLGDFYQFLWVFSGWRTYRLRDFPDST